MTTIPLAAQYMPLVRAGRKTSTVRKGRRTLRVGPAQIVSGGDQIAVHIQAVGYKTYDALSDADATADGFLSAADLKAALQHHYPNIQGDDICTIVEFKLT